VLKYVSAHRPDTIMQIVRATGADRARVYRILWAAYGPNFRDLWRLEKSEHGEFRNIGSLQIAA
jgi:hypothetical protein